MEGGREGGREYKLPAGIVGKGSNLMRRSQKAKKCLLFASCQC